MKFHLFRRDNDFLWSLFRIIFEDFLFELHLIVYVGGSGCSAALSLKQHYFRLLRFVFFIVSFLLENCKLPRTCLRVQCKQLLTCTKGCLVAVIATFVAVKQVLTQIIILFDSLQLPILALVTKWDDLHVRWRVAFTEVVEIWKVILILLSWNRWFFIKHFYCWLNDSGRVHINDWSINNLRVNLRV